MQPYINMKKTGENIRNLRRAKGLSVSSVQSAFGFSTPQAVYKWESGKSLPSIDNLVLLSAVLETGVGAILVVDEI